MHVLSETIIRLQQIIKTHATVLEKHETATRCALVDPMLQALGWDVTDPAVVTPEYQIPGFGKTKKYADYALFDTKPRKSLDREPSMILEVKVLGSPDTTMGDAERTAQNIASKVNTKYYAITDGNRWCLYKFVFHTTEPVLDFRLDEPNARILALCEKILPLGRMHLGKNLFSSNSKPTPPKKLRAKRSKKDIYLSDPKSDVSPSPSTNWISITKAYQTLPVPRTGVRPKFVVQFPDKTKVAVSGGWTRISQAVIDWLDQKQLLNNLTVVPIKKGKGQIFANTHPKSKTGKDFGQSYPAKISGLCFEMKMGSSSLVQATITLLEMAGQNPDKVLVGLKFK